MNKLATLALLSLAVILFLQPAYSYPKANCGDYVSQDTTYDGDTAYNGYSTQTWSASFGYHKTNSGSATRGSCSGSTSTDTIHISDDDGNSATESSGSTYTLSTNDYGWLQGGDDVTVYFEGGSATSSSVTRTMPSFAVTSPNNPSPNNGASDRNLDVNLEADIYDNSGHDSDVDFYDGSGSYIDTDYNVCSGCRASISWNNLNPGSNYDWYARADDGQTTARSSTWSFDTVHRPNQASNPDPFDTESTVDLSRSISVDVTHPDSLDMDVEFYLDDGSGFSYTATDTNVPDGGTASISPSLDPGTTYNWYTISRARSLTTQSPTWSFTTNYPPTIQSISTTDSQNGHAFSEVKAVITDSDGDGDISSYQLIVSDGEGNTQTYSGSIDRSYGNGNEAQATFTNIAANDDSGWSGAESMQLEVEATDSVGNTQRDSNIESFPNHNPEIASSISYTDYPGSQAYNLRIDAEDVDNGANEITQCTIEHNDGEGNSYTNAGSLDQGETAICRFTINERFSGYEKGDAINQKVTFTDRHGAQVTSNSSTHRIPNSPPTASNLQPSGTEVSYGPTLNATYNDPNGDVGNMTFLNASSGQIIDRFTSLAPGDHRTVQWSTATTPGKEYNFTVRVSDGVNSTNTTENFTTIYRPKAAYNPSPGNKTTVDTTTRTGDEIAASAKVVHPDGRPMHVQFVNATNGQIIEIDYNVGSGERAKITNIGNTLRDETNKTYDWYAVSKDLGTGKKTSSDLFTFDTVEVGDVMFDVSQGRNDNMDVTGNSDNGWSELRFEITSSQVAPIPVVTVNETLTGDGIKKWTDVENNSVLTVDLEQDGNQDWNLNTDEEYEWYVEALQGPNVIGRSLNNTIYTYNVSVDWDRSQQYYDVYQYDLYRARDTGNLVFNYGSGDYRKAGSLLDSEFKDSGPDLEPGTFCWRVAASNPTGSSDAVPTGDGECKTLN